MKIAFRPLLLLLALACAHWVGKDHAGEGKGEEGARPAPPAPVLPRPAPPPPCPACPPAPRPTRSACQNLPPPVVPEVAWAPPGCPVRKFGGCLTPADFSAHIRFLRAFETWRERCAK